MPHVRRVALLAVACLAGSLAVAAPAAAATPPAAPRSAPPASPPPASGSAAAAPARGGDELVGTYQRVAKDLVQPDGTLRDVYSDLLVTTRGAYRLRLPKGTTPVRVRGRLAGADLTAEEITAVGAPARVPTTGTTRVLVVLVHWSAPDSVTLTHARNQVFGDDHSWFGEASYGQLGLTGDATGWHQINPPTAGQCYSGHWEIMDQAKAKAKAAGFDPVNYDRTMVYFPMCGGDAAGAAGWAYMPGTDVWLNGYFDRRVSVHEQGHNYGLAHAHSLHCSDGGVTVTFGGACSMVEYGDDYDAMGASMYAAHFSAAQKQQLGWMAGRVRTLSNAPATFTLPALEQPAATPLAAVVPSGVAGRSYWMEHRKAIGMDGTLPPGATDGVLVRLADNSRITADDAPFLLDLTPHNTFGEAVLPPGGTWTSPEGVRISVGSVTSAGAEVTVEGGAAPPVPPTVPLDVAATAGDESARLTWDPPASNGGATVQSYVVSGAPGGLVRTVTDGTSTTVTGLTNGTAYTFTVAATNSAGTGPASAGVTATPTAQVPSVALTSPAEGATVSGLVQLSATAAPNPVSEVPIDFVSFAVDGEEVRWDYDAPYGTEWDTSEVADGPHTVTATAYDLNGRSATSAPVGVTVQVPRPAVAITAPADGAVVTDDLVTFEATATPAPGGPPISWVTYETPEGELVAWGDASAPHTGRWDVSALGGVRTVVARATDEAGRTGTSAPITITIDRPVPSVALTAPAPGATVSGVVTLSATATPHPVTNAAIDGVDFLVDGSSVGYDVDAPYGATWDSELYSGQHVLTAVVYDATGRTATSERVVVTVDNPLPTATVTSPTEGQVVSGQVTFTATAAPGISPVVSVDFTLDGFTPLGGVTGAGPYTVQWDSRDWPGEHSVTALVRDESGRRNVSEPVTFTVRTPVPTAVITEPGDGAVVRPGSRTLAVAAAPDPISGAPIVAARFSVDGTPVGTDTDPSDGFRVPWTATRGDHVVEADVQDADGFFAFATPVSVVVADPPGPPTGLAATAGADGTATLTFTPPADDGGRPVTGYVVAVSDGSERLATGSPYTVSGLTNGTPHTFRVKAVTTAGESVLTAASNAVTPGTATALSATLSASTVDHGKAVTLSGTLTGAGTPLSGRRVQLLACAPGTLTCSVVTTVTSSDVGRVAISYLPKQHRDLRLRYLPTGDRYLGSTSAARRVRVRAVVSSAVSSALIRLGRTVTVSGRVTPAHSGKLVYLQRLTSTGWRNVTSKAQSTTGYAGFSVKPATKGTHYYRLYFPGDTDHLAGTSPSRAVKAY